MATINLTTNYANYKYTGSAYGTATGYGATETAADNAARIAAVSAGNNASLSWSLNGTGTGSYLGYKLNSKTVTTSKEHSLQLTSLWESIFSYSVSQDNFFYLVHLNFNVSGLAASDINTATLNVVGGGGLNFNAYVCAPASSSVNIGENNYYHYDSSVFSSNRKEFAINSNSVNVDITDLLKQCINTEKGILVITGKIKNPPTGDYLFTPSFSLTYTNSITACTAPTSISDNGTGYIISGGSIKLKWSGAQGGTNNPISGYRIYWKQDSSPTTSSCTGYYDLNSTDLNCTFNSNTLGVLGHFPDYNDRGKIFYFKICAKGTNNLYSSISSVQTSIKFNQLPAVPTVSVDHRRFKSTGGSVTFTVTPGADGDTNLTKNVYWSTSISGEKTKIVGNTFTTPILNNQTVFLFWTYDGYEYSSNYDTKTITQNTAPTLGDVTLNINNSTNLFNDFNIDGFCASESCDSNGSIVSRKWELYLNGGETIVISGANTLSGFSNFNIVNNSHIAFGQIYRIRYTITDDVGESVTAASSPRTFPTPNISLYNKNGTGITDKFGKEIYLKYNLIGSYTAPYNFNGAEFYYKLSTSSNWIKLGNLNTTISNLNNKEKIDCSVLNSGSAYNLKIKYILSNGSSTEIDLGTKTKSIALNPIITVAGICYPFENRLDNTDNFSFSYLNNLLNDKTFKYYINNIEINRSYYDEEISNLERIISLDLPNIPTSVWQNYIGNGYTLNDSYSKELKIEIIDEFGDIYTDTKNWTFDFSNSLLSGATASVKIEATDNNYYDFSNGYPLFENQTLKVEINDLKSYCNETVTLVLTDNTHVEYSTSTLNLSVSGGTSNRPEYTNNNANFTFVMPKIVTKDKHDNYFVLEIKNGSNKLSKLISILENNKFVISRCDTNAIDLLIIKVEKNDNGYNFTCLVTDFGGYGTEPCKDNYSSIGLNIYYSADGNLYTKLNQTPEEIISKSIQNDSFTITISSSTLPGEKIYFKPEIIVTNNFQKVQNGTKTPAGDPTYTKKYTDTTYYIYYSSIPNLAYGKNFFLINTTDVGSCTNLALIIRPISGRNILYFGEDRYEATITMNSNSVILDNFVINGGTWDQS